MNRNFYKKVIKSGNSQIYETMDYNKFEMTRFNRDIDKIKPLVESMKRHGWIDAYPLHVIKNGKNKLRIKAGHNRFEVAKKLNIPIKYVLCEDNANIFELEAATNPWNLKHYLQSFCKCGNMNYIAVKEYHERTGINLHNCISMLGGETANSHNKSKLFKSGNFKINDRTHADLVADLVKYLKKHGVKFANHQNFVSALSRILWVEEFNVKTFKAKIHTNYHYFEKCPTVKEYIKMFEYIYNLRNKDKIPLEFLADTKAKERNPFKKK